MTPPVAASAVAASRSATRPPRPRSAAAGLSFRAIVNDDMPFLQRVYAATREAELAMVPWAPEQKAAFLDMQFFAQHAHYRQHHAGMDWLIISADDVDIGRLYLERSDDEILVVDIALLTEHRGRSFGGAVMRDILDEAAATGRRVAIHVEKFNPAMRLYARLGFVKVEDKGVYDFMRWTADELVEADQAETDQANTAS